MTTLAPVIGQADLSRKSKAFNDKKMEGNPHHGIVPTQRVTNLCGLSEIERNVYDLIVRSYIAQFYAHAVFSQTKIEVTIEGELFRAGGKTPVSVGWREVYGVADEDEGQGSTDGESKDPEKQLLPAMQNGDDAPCQACEVTARQTTPPVRFDEDRLLSAMINLHKYVDDPAAKARLKPHSDEGAGGGIGTSATRAGIIGDLRDRGFLEPFKGSKTKFVSTKAARGLIDALPGPVKDPVMAGMFKLALDALANGELSYEAFMQRNVGFVTKVVGQLRTASMNLPVAPSAPCPKCQIGVLRRINSEKGAFWGCSNYRAEPRCDASYQDADGQPSFKPTPKRPFLKRFKKIGMQYGQAT